MVMINIKKLRNKQLALFGMRGSGKTHFTKYLASNFKNPFIFDPLNEYTEFENRYIPSETSDFLEIQNEFMLMYDKVNWKKIDLLVIEEADLIAPSRQSYPFTLRKIISLGRHEGLTYVWITRRPAQMHTDISELADYLVVFKLDGKNDIDYLNSIYKGLGYTANTLDFNKHNFIWYERGLKPVVYGAVR